jgi:Mg/Co/Ni transporter MgtE
MTEGEKRKFILNTAEMAATDYPKLLRSEWRRGFLAGQIVSCIIWIAVLFLVAKVSAVTMSATVEPNECHEAVAKMKSICELK